jgi:hypothetical protein
MHVRSVGKYLARWGFIPQKPIKRAYEQSPAAVKEWLDRQYPQIAQRAKAVLCVQVHHGKHLMRQITQPGAQKVLDHSGRVHQVAAAHLGSNCCAASSTSSASAGRY